MWMRLGVPHASRPSGPSVHCSKIINFTVLSVSIFSSRCATITPALSPTPILEKYPSALGPNPHCNPQHAMRYSTTTNTRGRGQWQDVPQTTPADIGPTQWPVIHPHCYHRCCYAVWTPACSCRCLF